MATDLSNFDKQWSDANFVSFLFYYDCMPLNVPYLTGHRGLSGLLAYPPDFGSSVYPLLINFIMLLDHL